MTINVRPGVFSYKGTDYDLQQIAEGRQLPPGVSTPDSTVQAARDTAMRTPGMHQDIKGTDSLNINGAKYVLESLIDGRTYGSDGRLNMEITPGELTGLQEVANSMNMGANALGFFMGALEKIDHSILDQMDKKSLLQGMANYAANDSSERFSENDLNRFKLVLRDGAVKLTPQEGRALGDVFRQVCDKGTDYFSKTHFGNLFLKALSYNDLDQSDVLSVASDNGLDLDPAPNRGPYSIPDLDWSSYDDGIG